MKKVERYFYPAVFGYEPNEEISVFFPDLDVATSGENDDDALLSARELLGAVMYGLEEDNEEIPRKEKAQAKPKKENLFQKIKYTIQQICDKLKALWEKKEKNFVFYELNTSVLEEIMLWISDLKGESRDDKKES